MRDLIQEHVADLGWAIWRKDKEIKRLRDELADRDSKIKLLKDCLQDLVDEQNGPPLIRHEADWQKAMDNARALLKPGDAHPQD